ncbi:hypothetical protein D3C86_1454740 [compost metagenome]
MQHAAGARAAVGVLARILLQLFDEALEVLGGKFRVHRHHVGGVGKVGDRLEILDRIVRQVLRTASRIHGHRRHGGDGQRVAVGVGARGLGRADGATRAALVFHDHRLAEFLAHALRHEARDDVGGTAGRERNDHADGLAGVFVGGVGDGDAKRAGGAGGQSDGHCQGANFIHRCVSSKIASPYVNGPLCDVPACRRASR